MARIVVTLVGKGIREAGVEKLVQSLKHQYGEGVSVSTRKEKLPETRAERFDEATGKISEARSELESLKEELEQWKDGLPENLQDGTKAGELEEAIDKLAEMIDSAETLEGEDVSFPSMMG